MKPALAGFFFRLGIGDVSHQGFVFVEIVEGENRLAPTPSANPDIASLADKCVGRWGRPNPADLGLGEGFELRDPSTG